MSNLSEIVDSLENRVGKLIQKYDKLKNSKLKLEEELTVLKSKQSQFVKEIDKWQNEKIMDTYIKVSDGHRDCDFSSNWLKK